MRQSVKLVEFKSYIRPDQLEWLNREAAKRDDAGQGRGAGTRQRSGLLREVIDAAIIGYGTAEKALKQCKGSTPAAAGSGDDDGPVQLMPRRATRQCVCGCTYWQHWESAGEGSGCMNCRGCNYYREETEEHEEEEQCTTE